MPGVTVKRFRSSPSQRARVRRPLLPDYGTRQGVTKVTPLYLSFLYADIQNKTQRVCHLRHHGEWESGRGGTETAISLTHGVRSDRLRREDLRNLSHLSHYSHPTAQSRRLAAPTSQIVPNQRHSLVGHEVSGDDEIVQRVLERQLGKGAHQASAGQCSALPPRPSVLAEGRSASVRSRAANAAVATCQSRASVSSRFRASSSFSPSSTSVGGGRSHPQRASFTRSSDLPSAGSGQPRLAPRRRARRPCPDR